jgi:hypothetical protein
MLCSLQELYGECSLDLASQPRFAGARTKCWLNVPYLFRYLPVCKLSSRQGKIRVGPGRLGRSPDIPIETPAPPEFERSDLGYWFFPWTLSGA